MDHNLPFWFRCDNDEIGQTPSDMVREGVVCEIVRFQVSPYAGCQIDDVRNVRLMPLDIADGQERGEYTLLLSLSRCVSRIMHFPSRFIDSAAVSVTLVLLKRTLAHRCHHRTIVCCDHSTYLVSLRASDYVSLLTLYSSAC